MSLLPYEVVRDAGGLPTSAREDVDEERNRKVTKELQHLFPLSSLSLTAWGEVRLFYMEATNGTASVADTPLMYLL